MKRYFKFDFHKSFLFNSILLIFHFLEIISQNIPAFLTTAGVEIKIGQLLDGINILPFISGKNKTEPQDVLYWGSWW